jgi:AcrR family transcriptional regulator
MVERDGHESLSVRELARACGVSAAAPFRHFQDRDDLLRAVAWRGVETYIELAQEASAAAGDEPLAQFRALGINEVRFAIHHPNLMRLMRLPSMQEPPSTATEEQRERTKSMNSRSRHLVEAAQARGTLRGGSPAVLELAGVALAFGLSQMFLDGLLPREGGEAFAESVLDVLGSGFRPGPEC